MRQILRWGVPVLVASSGLRLWSLAGAMPAVVGSKFDFSGNATNVMSRQGFLTIAVAMLLVCAVIFVGLPILIERYANPAWINLPHREYWLAPERRQATLTRIADQMRLFGLVHTAFLVLVLDMASVANVPTAVGLPMWMLTGMLPVYLVGTSLWTWRLVQSFQQTPAPA